MFDHIKGQDKVKSILERLIRDQKIGHAYIFEGASGTNKLEMALAFAGAIVGTDNSTSHPDVRIITNELYDLSKAERKALSIDTVRQMKAEVYIKPYKSAKKVYIIPNADTVTVKSAFLAVQNSMLKVFEEPPNYCTIILLAENANSFLPTILSRATIIKFSSLDKDEYLRYLLSDDGIAELREEILKHMSQLMIGSYSAAYGLTACIKAAVKRDKNTSDVIFEIIGLFLTDLLHERHTDISIAPKTAAAMLDVYIKYRKIINANGNFSAAIELMALGILDEIRRAK